MKITRWSINFYSSELFWRVSYCLFSLLSLIMITWTKMDVVIFLELIPFFNIGKKFILLNVTDLIELFWLNCISVSSFFTWPLFVVQSFLFFKSSWYPYQLKFISIIFFRCVLIICTAVFIVCYLKILPNVLSFFMQHGEVLNWSQILLIIETQLNILSYTAWIIEFYCFLNFWILALTYCFIILSWEKNLTATYFFIKKNRNAILFNTIILTFLVIPPELIQQLIIFFLLTLLSELICFSICIKIINNFK